MEDVMLVMQEERKILKSWLFSFFLFYFMLAAAFSFSFFSTPGSSLISSLMPPAIIFAPSFLIIYYFAYKKRGIILLTWIMIRDSILLIKFLIFGFVSAIYPNVATLFIFCFLCLLSYHLFNSFKLLKINRLRKALIDYPDFLKTKEGEKVY